MLILKHFLGKAQVNAVIQKGTVVEDKASNVDTIIFVIGKNNKFFYFVTNLRNCKPF